jgi:glycine/D-amino acid oxidase-like deaminating enzyme
MPCPLPLSTSFKSSVRISQHERSYPGSGTSGACEGNVLAWDKELRRELPLAIRSAELWATLAEQLPDDFEYDRKGSLVVAETEAELAVARERAAALAAYGVAGQVLDASGLREEEPHSAAPAAAIPAGPAPTTAMSTMGGPLRVIESPQGGQARGS